MRDFHYRYDLLQNGLMVSNKKSLMRRSAFYIPSTDGLVTDFYNFRETERLALKRIVTDQNGHPVKETYYVDAVVFYCDVEPLLDRSCFYSTPIPLYFPYKPTGEGTKEKPWNNIYEATKIINCYYHMNCCNRYAVLKIRGKINYSLSAFIGYDELFVLYDLTDLEFQFSDKIKESYYGSDWVDSNTVILMNDNYLYAKNLNIDKKIQTNKELNIILACKYLSNSEINLEINNNLSDSGYYGYSSFEFFDCIDSDIKIKQNYNISRYNDFVVGIRHGANIGVDITIESNSGICRSQVVLGYYDALFVDCEFNQKVYSKNGYDATCDVYLNGSGILKNVTSRVNAVCDAIIDGDDITGYASAIGFREGSEYHSNKFISCTALASSSAGTETLAGCEYRYAGFVGNAHTVYYNCSGTIGEWCRRGYCRWFHELGCDPYGDIV